MKFEIFRAMQTRNVHTEGQQRSFPVTKWRHGSNRQLAAALRLKINWQRTRLTFPKACCSWEDSWRRDTWIHLGGCSTSAPLNSCGFQFCIRPHLPATGRRRVHETRTHANAQRCKAITVASKEKSFPKRTTQARTTRTLSMQWLSAVQWVLGEVVTALQL